MNIQKWTGTYKKISINLTRKNGELLGGRKMEAVIKRNNTFKPADDKKVLEAIKECTIEYEKALKNLAK